MRKCIAYFCLILDLIQAASDTLIPQANPVDMPLSSRDLTRNADRLNSYFRTLNSIKVMPSELNKGLQNTVDLLVDNERIHAPANQKGIDSVTKIHLDRGKLQRYLDILDLESATKPVTIQLDPSRVMNYVKILNDMSRSTSQPNGLIYKSRIKMMKGPSPILGADGKERFVGDSLNQNDLSLKEIERQRNLRGINPANVNSLLEHNEISAVKSLRGNDEKSNLESDIYYSDDNNDQQNIQIKNNYRKVVNDMPLSERADNEMLLPDISDTQYEDYGDLHYDIQRPQEDTQNGMQTYYVGEENQKSLCPEGEISPLRDISNNQLNEQPKFEQSIGSKTSNSGREQDKGSDYIISKDKANIKASPLESKNLNKAGEYYHSISTADVSLNSADQSLIQTDSYVSSVNSENRIDNHSDASNQSLNQLKDSNISLQVNFSIPISGMTPAPLVTYAAKDIFVEEQSHMRSELSPSLKGYTPKNNDFNIGNNQIKVLGLPIPQPILSKPAEFNLSKLPQNPFGQLSSEKIPIGSTNIDKQKEMVQIRNESIINKGEPFLDQTKNPEVVPMVGTSSPITALSETNLYRSINVENSKSGIMNNTGLFVCPVQKSLMPSGGNPIPQESVKRDETNISSINTNWENVLPTDLTRMSQNDVIVLNESSNKVLPDQKVFQSQGLSVNESNQSGMNSRALGSKNTSFLIEQDPGKTLGDSSSLNAGGREQPLTKENNVIQNTNSNLQIKGTGPKEITMSDKNQIFHVEAGHPGANNNVVTENKSNMPLISSDQTTMNRQVKRIEEIFNSSANAQRVIASTPSSIVKEQSRTNQNYETERAESVQNAHKQTPLVDQQKSYLNNTSQEFVWNNDQQKNLLPAVNERPVHKATLFEKPSNSESLSLNESNPNLVLTKPVQEPPQLVINSGDRSTQIVKDQQSTKTEQITPHNKGQINLTEAKFQKGQEESNFIKNTNTTVHETLKTSNLQIPLDNKCFNGHNPETKPQISPSSDSAKENLNICLELKNQPLRDQKSLPNFNSQTINDQVAHELYGNGQNIPSVITEFRSQSNTSLFGDVSKYERGSKASLQFPEMNQDLVASRQQINTTNDFNTNPLVSNDLSPIQVVPAFNKNSGNSIETGANTAVKITSDINTNSSSSGYISKGNEADMKQVQIPRQIGTSGNLEDSVSLELSHSAHDVLPLQPKDEISDIRNLGGLSRFLETDKSNSNKAGVLFYKPTKPPFMFDEYYENFINKLKSCNKLTDNTRFEGTNENEILTILNKNLEHMHPDKGALCKIIGKALISEDKENEQKLLPKWIVEKYDEVERVFHRGQTQFEPPSEDSRKNSEVSEPIYPRAMDKWKEKSHSLNRRSINFFKPSVTTDNDVTQIKTEYPGKGQNVNILFPSNS